MMDAIARLLTEPTNYAIVQLPDRKFPGVVFQGDSIHALLQQIRDALSSARKHGDDDLNMELEDAIALLSAAEERLKAVCAQEGIELPFPSG
jgi:hypothetical protein